MSTPSFAALLLDDERQRASAMSAALSRLTMPRTRVVRVDGRLRTLLTLEHVTDRAAAAVARALTERQGSESEILLVIEQAETLPLATLGSLQAMARHFNEPGRPALRVLFVGRPTFRALLAGRDLAPLRQALGLAPVRAARKAWSIAGLATLALLAGIGAIAYRSLEAAPDSIPPIVSTPPIVAATAAARAPSVLSAPAAPPPASPPAPESEPERLHREFAAFLASSGRSAASLTPAQRDAVVSEFLRRSPPAAAPQSVPARPAAVAAPRPAPRIVVHVPSGPGPAVLATRLLAGLATRSARVETRHVAEGPARPSIRYFRPDDEAAARQVAQWMAGAGLAWTLQDFAGYEPRPSAGTIEVWLPSQP